MLAQRIFNVALAAVLFVPAILICIPALVAIWIETNATPVFVQERVGQAQKPFRLLKLRTMTVGTADVGSHDVSPAQITKVGRFLRKCKIDELPQIWNVLVGHMNFVGPRPCLPNQTKLIKERAKRGVFDIRPGITGPAQLAGIDMSQPERLSKVDADYVGSRTFRGDLVLIVKTGLGGGRGDAARSDAS